MSSSTKNNEYAMISILLLMISIFLAFSTVKGGFWGLCLIAIYIIASNILEEKKRFQYKMYVSIFLFFATCLILFKLIYFNGFKFILPLRFFLAEIKSINFHTSNYFEELKQLYYFSADGAIKYWYAIFTALFMTMSFSICNIINLIQDKEYKKLKDLKAGKVTEKKDRISQKKLIEICKKRINPLRDEIGVDVNTGKPVVIVDKVLKYVLMILGKTGSGKTESLKNLYYRIINRDVPLIIINAKPDKQLEKAIQRWCKEAETPFYAFGCLSHDNYNFLKTGGQTSLTDKMMGLKDEWSNDHYKTRAQAYLQAAIYIFKQTRNLDENEDVCLKDFIKLFDKNYLENIVSEYNNKFKKNFTTGEDFPKSDFFGVEDDIVHKEITDKTSSSDIDEEQYNPKVQEYFDLLEGHDADELKGLKDIFALLYTSELSDSLASHNSKRSFDLESVIKNKEVIYFSLDVLQYDSFAPMIGKVIFNDLKSILTERTEGECNENPIFLGVDEFSRLACPQFTNVVDMGRGFNCHTILGTQSLSNLDNVSKEFKETMMGNINSLLIHTVPSPNDSEYLSKWVGTKKSITATAKQDESDEEAGSLREVDEFIIHPNDIKRGLGIGMAFYINSNEKTERKIQVAQVKEAKTIDEYRRKKLF